MTRRKSSRKSSPAAPSHGAPADAREDNSRADGKTASQPDAASAAANKRKSGGKSKVRVEQTADGTWQLVHPRCAIVRREDLEEVAEMIEAGEGEIARDELRWLLSECHDFLAGHKLLGDLALAENDVRLARGHYGYAYQLGAQALEGEGQNCVLPYRQAANREFFEAGRGLLECLTQQGKRGMAKKVLEQLLKCDPSDPLKLRELVNAPRGGCGEK